MKPSRGAILSVFLTSLFLASSLMGQEQPPPQADRARRQEMEHRLQEAFQRRLREELELSQEEGRAVRDIWGDVALDRQELRAEERLLGTRIQRLIRDGGDDAAAQQLLDRLLEIRQREVDIFREEQSRLLEVLGPARLLKMNVLRNELNERIRRAQQRGSGLGGLDAF